MKMYSVTDLTKVDAGRYKEGDFFMTDKQVAVWHKGKIEPLVKQSDLKGYVKKTEVVKLIDAGLKKVTPNG